MNQPKANEKFLLKIKRFFNPGEWNACLLGLSKSHGTSSAAGLVMIQIDGFGLTQFQEAIRRKEMPFLESLLKQEKYRLHPFYSGLPSTTPAVQGELFYGVKQIVPSFFFFDRESQSVFRMFDGDSVRAVESRLAKQGPGLLEGGSSYSNIFTGGAQEAHFCAASLGWHYIWKDINILNFILLLLTHFFAMVRMTVLVAWETVLAIHDFIYGLLKKEDVEVEFKFVSLRVLLCILLRELVTLGAKIDIARGLPIIHLNFIGYDEQAHRRRPASKTAHWALKGIDQSIARLYSAAIHSSRRHYDVWVYSDHGQELTLPYIGVYGQSVEERVERLFYEMFPDHKMPASKASSGKGVRQEGIQLQRGRYLGKWVEKIWPLNQERKDSAQQDVIVAAMGPLGGVYISRPLTRQEKLLFGKALVVSAKIPLVLMPEDNGKVRAWNEQGEFVLPEQAKEVLDSGHPFFNDVIHDLLSLCHHPNAGTFTISGWRLGQTLLSFPFENGAHAGPGKEETGAFALLPSDIKRPSQKRDYLKTRDLRELALRFLKKSSMASGPFCSPEEKSPPQHLPGQIRLMTYNVHSCVGMDGKISPERIARVIARYEPDIVALQELDMGRERTNHDDQPHLIARALEMMCHFYPSIQVEEEQFGNAILSRYPMELVRATALPQLKNRINLEPRGALWVSLNLGPACLQVINTHLSYFAPECHHQAKALMSPEWIDHPHCLGPVVLCGDFNCLPHSRPWRTMNHRLRDAQHLLGNHRPLATWGGQYLKGRIDHIFMSPHLKVRAIDVPRTKFNTMASDHLPLIIDVEVVP